ncbi:hypothetical protein [Rhizobium leguminosarum]|uniref:hypothetical protein n=1 Tax=Rhizobium leguminosarum TaxID=384 RepID=UPI00161F02B7|nr:hypothetical protein [Rhizobium leguminosarum]MBB4465430.1 hypothetical protein [Rhizobium leguminosarum]MBB4472092.1 hypothetical protein [Rhizobium leguminosarum]
MAFDRDSYLSHFPGYYLMASCTLCKREANYGTDDIRAKQGDSNLAGLKTTIAELWGCKRLLNLNWNRCRLEVRMGGRIKKEEELWMGVQTTLRRIGAWKAESWVKLGDLASYHHLYGACRCGHIGYIQHEALKAKYGAEATLGDLKPKLQCKRNPEHETLIFAIAQDKR